MGAPNADAFCEPDRDGEDEELAPVFVNPDNLEGEVVADYDEDDAPPEEEDDDEELDQDACPLGNGGRVADDVDDEDMEEVEGEVYDGPEDALQVLQAHSDAVLTCAWSPRDATSMVSGGCDDMAFLWKIQGLGPDAVVSKTELAGHTDTVSHVGYSADGALVATAGLDGKVMIWDVEGKQKCQLEGPAEGLEFLKWHPRGPVVLAGSEDYSAWMWNASTGACMQVFTGHGGSVNCGTFTPDGKTVVTGSLDGTLRAWDPRSGACTLTVQGHPYHESGLTSLDCDAEGGLIVSGSEDKSARLVALASGKVKGSLLGHTDSVESVAFCPCMNMVASGSMDGTVMIWDLQTLAIRATLMHGNQDGVVSLKWLPNSPVVVTCVPSRCRGFLQFLLCVLAHTKAGTRTKLCCLNHLGVS